MQFLLFHIYMDIMVVFAESKRSHGDIFFEIVSGISANGRTGTGAAVQAEM